MEEYLEVHSHQLSGIEELARRLFQGEFEGPQGLWKIEIDLANYQIGLQKEIARERAARRETKAKIAEIAANREKGWKKQLQELEEKIRRADDRIDIYSHAHTISRQLGDALAWLLLKLDESTIIPLTENLPVPPISSGMGLDGMLAVAKIYADAGAGFPIIHDITNCLRVGDITFASPHDEPITVEVKTHVISREGNTVRFRIETYATVGAERWKTIEANVQRPYLEITDPLPDEKVIRKPMNQPNRRLARQLERMSRAIILQTAQSGGLIDVRGEDYLIVRAKSDSRAHHWDLMRELTIKAKANGCASSVVDDAFVYVATYTDPPNIYPWSRGADISFEGIIRADDIGAKLPLCSETDDNYLWFESSWRHLLGEVPPPIRPFFLYPIPSELLIDIMWGRLSVMVFVNLGKLVEAVKSSGFTARLPKGETEFLVVSTKISLPDGNQVEIRLGDLRMLGMKLVFEFFSVNWFVDVVHQMVNDMAEVAKTKWESDASLIE